MRDAEAKAQELEAAANKVDEYWPEWGLIFKDSVLSPISLGLRTMAQMIRERDKNTEADNTDQEIRRSPGRPRKDS